MKSQNLIGETAGRESSLPIVKSDSLRSRDRLLLFGVALEMQMANADRVEGCSGIKSVALTCSRVDRKMNDPVLVRDSHKLREHLHGSSTLLLLHMHLNARSEALSLSSKLSPV